MRTQKKTDKCVQRTKKNICNSAGKHICNTNKRFYVLPFADGVDRSNKVVVFLHKAAQAQFSIPYFTKGVSTYSLVLCLRGCHGVVKR